MPVSNLVLRSLGPSLEILKPHLRRSSFSAGQRLNEPLDRVTMVQFPTAGLISGRAVLTTGHELECVLVGPNNMLGGVNALNSDLSMTRDMCLTDVEAWSIPLSRLRQLMLEHRFIEAQVRRFAFAQLGYAIQMGVCNAMHRIEPRLARWLTTAADLLGASEVCMAQEELANVLGVQRSALNPLLQRFKEQELIEVSRGRILLCDAAGLEARACDCRRGLREAAEMDATAPDYDSVGTPFGL